MYKVNDKEFECSVAVTLDVFSDKWKLFIIWHLLSQPKRFKELNQALSEISQKTLTVKLKELEEKKVIYREVFAQVPPKVVYSLTPIGEKLRPLFKHMYLWGIEYVDQNGEILESSNCCEADIAKKIGI